MKNIKKKKCKNCKGTGKIESEIENEKVHQMD